MNPGDSFLRALKFLLEHDGYSIQVDRPEDEKAGWFADVFHGDKLAVIIEYRPGKGFGISRGEDDGGFNTSPDYIVEDFRDALLFVCRLTGVLRQDCRETLLGLAV